VKKPEGGAPMESILGQMKYQEMINRNPRRKK